METLFLGFVGLNSRGYQDLWILQDIWIPTIAYIATFVIIALKINDNKALVFLCAAFLVTLNAIPNLKYQFFVGTFDSAAHYGFANQILLTGHVSTTAFYSSQYADFPGMHIILSSISLILGINLVDAVKLLTSIIYCSIPFLFYFVSNKIEDKKLQKYIIISSGLPVTAMSYVLGGAEFATPFLIAFVCLFLRRNFSHPIDQKYTVVLLLVFLGLLFSHAVTSLSLVLFLGLTLIILFFLGLLKHSSFCFAYVIDIFGIFCIISVMLFAWFYLQATSIFQFLTTIFESYIKPNIGTTPVPSTFFGVPLFDKFRILLLYYARDAVVSILSFVGIFVLLKYFLPSHRNLVRKLFLPLVCFIGAILLLLGFDFVTGRSEYVRFIAYALALSPLLVGFSFWGIDKRFSRGLRIRHVKSILVFIIIFSTLCISIVQIFPYQPLMPKANVLSKALPANEFLFDVQEINTIYQVSMISFASNFSPNNLNVTSDLSTRWQIAGFASEDFSNQDRPYSPLQTNLTSIGVNWNICLMHYDGKAGPLNEFIGNRTKSVVDEFRETSGDTIYDNGESFIVFHEPG